MTYLEHHHLKLFNMLTMLPSYLPIACKISKVNQLKKLAKLITGLYTIYCQWAMAKSFIIIFPSFKKTPLLWK